VVQQMGPGSFFFRLGLIGILAFLGWLATRRPATRDSVVQQLGRTSLLIYWVHVEICYGFATRPLQKRLTFTEAAVAYLLLCLAMYGLSLWKTRHWPALRDRLSQRLARGAG
jgi:fucose 4-O-acetylase-like acetyltransferase